MHVQYGVLKLLCFLKIAQLQKELHDKAGRDRDTFAGATHRTGHDLSILPWNIYVGDFLTS